MTNQRNQLINKILDALYYICGAEGGDGDTTWYTSVFSLEEIMACIKEYNSTSKFPWKIDLSDDTITLTNCPEECIIITSNMEVFNQRPMYGKIQT